jgi:hypothetical protein
LHQVLAACAHRQPPVVAEAELPCQAQAWASRMAMVLAALEEPSVGTTIPVGRRPVVHSIVERGTHAAAGSRDAHTAVAALDEPGVHTAVAALGGPEVHAAVVALDSPDVDSNLAVLGGPDVDNNLAEVADTLAEEVASSAVLHFEEALEQIHTLSPAGGHAFEDCCRLMVFELSPHNCLGTSQCALGNCPGTIPMRPFP